MATTKTNTTVTDPGEEYVEYSAPRDYSGRRSSELRVAVNGEMIRIKRGTTQRIKRKFVEALENSMAQEDVAQDTISGLVNS